MALLEKLYQHYIQLKEDGIIEIHRSIADRLKQKLATKSEIILEKYNEKINEQSQKAYDYVVSLGLDPYNLTEEQYENLKNNDPFIIECSRIAEEWSDEKFLYENDLWDEKGSKHVFPLMAKIFKDVENSIPYIIEKAQTQWKSINIEDIYKEAKEKLRFGETEDC